MATVAQVKSPQVKSLPDLILKHGRVSHERLQQAQAEASRTGQPLKRVLVKQGVIAEQDLTAIVAAQAGVTTIDLSDYLINPDVIKLVPESLARKHVLIPVFKTGDSLTVAMEDPLNVFAIDELRLKTKLNVKAAGASESSIRQAIEEHYGGAGTVAEAAEVVRDTRLPKKDEAAAGEAPVIRLVNLLIMQAVTEKASDIHIEPLEDALRTRFRVDGVLEEVNGPPASLHSPVVSRIKVLSKLDIAEKRKPQDGRFQLKMEGKEIDLRVSTIPTEFGEKVVMRLLDSANMSLSFKKLGLDEEMSANVEKLIRLPHGFLLVTGPTGSGKTTTLYAGLSLINDITRNVITIEDPVEYRLRGINQVQVNPRAEVSFASALRSFLRQDPDVIMVGEVRDRETAEIAIQAALTGHMVFSTLHTNDAPGALTRLIEMGIEPFLIASSVAGVLAQRLVRVICTSCKESYRPEAGLVSDLGLKEEVQFFRGKGCASCKQSGYRGRIGIYELLKMTEEIKALVMVKASAHEIQQTARKAGMRMLGEDGLAKALAGVTSLEEVLRVTRLAQNGEGQSG